MEPSLITTKLNIPPVRAGLVARPRLLECLKTAINYGLVLVSAPAGFGKTTLLSEWARQVQPGFRTAWVSLEAAESDPVRFWDYFIAAIGTIRPGAGEAALPLLHSPQPPPVEAVLTILINDLATVPVNFIVILDDYHVIDSSPVHEGVTYLLEHLPGQMHLVIAARGDPPLPLSRFRGRGVMLEVRTDDLRFKDKEATDLVELLKAPALSGADIASLNERTEGWVVGLKMALLSMSGRKDIPGFIAAFTGSQRYVMDYLMEEVLRQQAPEMVDFLLQTSVLERLSAPLCDAVTGGSNSREMLSKLENNSLFIVPLEETSEWYRYEHLFAELLRHRLEQEQGKEKMRELQIKASAWFDENDFREDAINHALAGEDWQRAIDLVLVLTSGFAHTGRWNAIASWLGRVPRDVLFTNPEASVLHAYFVSLTGRLDTAWELLDEYENSTSYKPSVAGSIASIRGSILFRRREPGVEEYATRALSLLPPDDLGRPLTLYMLGTVYLINLDGRAEPILKEAYEAFLHLGDRINAGLALVSLAVVYLFRGEPRRAEMMLKEAILAAGEHSVAAPAARLSLAELYYMRNELAAAAAELEAVLLAAGWGQHLSDAHLKLLRVRLAQGDIEAAEKELEEAKTILFKGEPTKLNLASIAVHHLAIAAAEGNDEEIESRLEEFASYENNIAFDPIGAAMHLLYKRRGKGAMKRLEAKYQHCRREGLSHICCSTRLDQVAAAADPEQALSYLSEALGLARPEGIIRRFVDVGIELVPLLRRLISRGVEPEYARRLLTIIEKEDRQRKIRKGETPPAAGPLSEREMEVLRLMDDGRSNQEIAARLVISLSTAKNHVHSILDKLEVRSRTRAVTAARELGLI